MAPAHFFQGRSFHLEWRHVPAAEIPWEIFKGRLLDASQTRVKKSFESWDVFRVDNHGRSGLPVISVKFDEPAGEIHVVRAIECHAWKGYHAGDNVFLSREIRKWIPELVGTIRLARVQNVHELRNELTCRLFQAVVGTSRLPLTSVEAPLPGFSLGEFAYFFRTLSSAIGPEQGPITSPHDLLASAWTPALSLSEKAKLVEFGIRAAHRQQIGDLAESFLTRSQTLELTSSDITLLFRTVFEETALSPYTDFVDKTLDFLGALVERRALEVADYIDLCSYLMRQLGRHLTAYDLITFHHRGANYPDALLLDALLKTYFGLVENHSDLFFAAASDSAQQVKAKRLRRRGLRQGWLVRRFYEGHLVPDAPTSLGENVRVLPRPYQRVAEEQILVPAKRTTRLYENDPLSRHLGEQGRSLLRQSLKDLAHPLELRELGMAIFVDRPLGVWKEAGESDQTPLLSYEAWSRSVTEQRLSLLARYEAGLSEDELAAGLQRVQGLTARGIAFEPGPEPCRTAPVALEDVSKVAGDFAFLRTTAKTMNLFLELFDWSSLARQFCLDFLAPGRAALVMRARSRAPGEQILAMYDDRYRKRLELQILGQGGYESRVGIEYPSGGLQVLRWWEPAGAMGELQEKAPTSPLKVPIR